MEGFAALYIFMLAAFTGYEVIARVPVILHTPLMSGSNFVHGVVLVGAMVALGQAQTPFEQAIGFVAVWSVLSNFLCTFVLIVFKPFSVGDELELPGENVKGRVVDLSLIFTTLEVAHGEMVMVPNNTYFQRVFKRRIGHRTSGLAEQLRSEKPAADLAAAGDPGTRA